MSINKQSGTHCNTFSSVVETDGGYFYLSIFLLDKQSIVETYTENYMKSATLI